MRMPINWVLSSHFKKLLVSFIAGSLLPLAFAPFSLWILAFVLPVVPVYLVLNTQSDRSIFALGWCFGFGYFCFGLYWIYNSLHDFGMASPAVAGFLTLLLPAYLALFIGFTFYLWKKLVDRLGAPLIWSLPMIWFSMEWLKGWLFTGMPWLSLGYSQTDSYLSSYGAIVGVYGISAICILIGVSFLVLIKGRRFSMILLPVGLMVTGYGLEKVDWTSPVNPPLKVAMVQGNIPQHIKWRYDQRQNILDTYWQETEKLWDNDLIVWPETAIPGRSEEIEQSVLLPIATEAARHDASLLTGVVVSRQNDDAYFNSVLLLGAEQGEYDKRHLVIFGEYFPLRGLLDNFRHLINIPFSNMSEGTDNQIPVKVKGHQLGISICFEDVFSRNILRDLPGASILVNVSNDAWFGDSTAPHQHLQIARMRAIESGRPLIRSTNTGVSAFIGRKGGVKGIIDSFKTGSLTNVVSGQSGSTPFYYFQKIQGYLSLFVLIIFIACYRLVRR